MTIARRIQSNTSGTYLATRKSFMAAFDKLPRRARCPQQRQLPIRAAAPR
ncbi:MAG TPA: hypothetical protein VG758_06940 [Hyphomicrobiaceae bacterium]|nr:hypothetical protein [Hyphomicrobiaceae bacterium]